MPWANANMVLNSRDRTNGQYNNSQFNATGQNIVQGQVHSVSLNEINFPYDIPNMQAGFNSFLIYLADGTAQVDYQVVVPPGFYTGTELAAAITAGIIAGGLAQVPPVVAADLPTCTYNTTTNRFTFVSPVNPVYDQSWEIVSSFTNPSPALLPPNNLGKDILSIMGFPPEPGALQIGSGPGGFQVAVSGSAPLAFTQYIDICSPQLCKYQDFQGGSTTNLARRSDLIARVYISNNIAIQESEGTRPFVINRQYANARVMKWNTGNSIGAIDIVLYDDVGQPLLATWIPRPYQITFNCYEMDTEEKEVFDPASGGTITLPRHTPYQAKNLAAWNSGSFPMSR
jgi:hypothetical protein